MKDKQLPVRLITMTVGRAKLPDAIKSQRIETAAQEQRVQTEKQIKLAEDQRKAAEESRARPTMRIVRPSAYRRSSTCN